MKPSPALPEGVICTQLTRHQDARGDLTEVFRQDWPGLIELTQWNASRNEPNVFRGMHVHPLHTDYMVVLEGRMLLGLVDIRPDSATRGLRTRLDMSGDRPSGVLIPPGVLHGFYVPDGNFLVWGMSHGWTRDDEIECRWDDHELGLDWPAISAPALSERDAKAPDFKTMVERYRASLETQRLTSPA